MKEFVGGHSCDEWLRFREFLQKLPKAKKPFSCPTLTVLTESVRYHSKVYPKGSLICSSGMGGGNVICGLQAAPITFDAQGNIEIACSWRAHKVALSIVHFKLNPRAPIKI